MRSLTSVVVSERARVRLCAHASSPAPWQVKAAVERARAEMAKQVSEAKTQVLAAGGELATIVAGGGVPALGSPTSPVALALPRLQDEGGGEAEAQGGDPEAVALRAAAAKAVALLATSPGCGGDELAKSVEAVTLLGSTL